MNQSEAAKHLDMSERNFRDVLRGLGISWPADIDNVRITYIRDLREKAAGRGGDAQGELVQARIRETNANADLKELLAEEKAGELVNVADIEPQLVSMVTAARQELLTLPEKLANDVKAIHGVEVDESLIRDRIYDSLRHLASRLSKDDDGHDGESGEGLSTTTKINDNRMGE